MPAYSEKDNALSTKLLTFFPKNTNISTHAALIVVFDCCTGIPKAIMDGDVITAQRTAAASAAATKHLTNGIPRQLAILGAGVQARSHYHALSYLYKFQQVKIWNHHMDKAKLLAAELGPEVEAVPEAKEAIQDADVIVTVTNSSVPVLQASWVKQGAHINAVGSCRPDWNEIAPELMHQAVVYVDTKEAAVKESGDIIKSGATIFAEIGEVIAGKAAARTTETTIFKSLGMAIEDTVTANLVMKKLDGRT
ncbi:ketimine reductase mu-crystallin-like isoform X2 [Pomacea canaliculata]|nr:ketimine reductase mu-crystallin-like isoform X2 [Pomacea canaliculata]